MAGGSTDELGAIIGASGTGAETAFGASDDFTAVEELTVAGGAGTSAGAFGSAIEDVVSAREGGRASADEDVSAGSGAPRTGATGFGAVVANGAVALGCSAPGTGVAGDGETTLLAGAWWIGFTTVVHLSAPWSSFMLSTNRLGGMAPTFDHCRVGNVSRLITRGLGT